MAVNRGCSAEVDVDRETGDLELRRYVVVNDCGRMINPMIVEGQIAGGIAQGAGGALLEELVYDEQGQLLTASLLDYPLPTSLDLPMIEISHLVSPSNLNPLGVKEVGEGGAIGAHAAVANAIAHIGAQVRETPLRPAVVWKLLNEKAVQSASLPVPAQARVNGRQLQATRALPQKRGLT
jgi:aerobic carbon-monoxide dehydrogenase large subunit